MNRTMRHLLLLASLSLSLGVVSCNENNPSSTADGSQKRLLVPTVASSSSTAAARTGSAGAASPAGGGAVTPAQKKGISPTDAFVDVPAAPSNAQWTIYCTTVEGPSHIEQSRDFKRRLAQITGLKDWYIVHGSEESTVYFGFYRSIDDPKDPAESRRAQDDRHRLDAWKDSTGARPFSHCMFVELSTPNPEAPPEWDLTRAPDWASYTVEVAAFKNNTDRKRAAVEGVREFRKRGIEAYYYHGPSVSSICLGLWPETAVTQPAIIDPKHPERGIKSDTAEKIVVVDPNLPDITKNLSDENGTRVLAVQPRAVIADQKLAAMIREYPDHYVNGVIMIRPSTNKPAEHSFVARVPDRTYSLLDGGGSAISREPGSHSTEIPGLLSSRLGGDDTPAPAPQKAAGGKLKSLDR
jgi:hypothetical protein